MSKLYEKLKNFTSDNLVGIKQSFEDEGALLEDIKTIRKLGKS